ncbi:restriction endonuclease subunit S [Streptococcus suis]|nr:restriction endonuclease subunit S [Streptococcus suis]
MKTNNNIPAYRFQGYTDAWELRKLGEVVEVCSGRDYKHLGVGSIPVYGTGGYMLSVSEALSKNNDAIGIGRKGTIDSPYILRAPFWTVDTLFYCIPNDGFTLEFAYSIFQNINWKSMDESTGVPSLSKNGINNVKVLTPKIKEQSAIGTFFSTLDRQITLHQRKLDTLKEQKKTYLKLLFPAKGQTKPDLRFQGFEDDWEEVKLGEVVEKSGSGGTPKSTNKAYYGGNIPFLSITDITQSGKYITNTEKTLTEIGLENSSAWKVPKGAISLAMYASVGKLAILKTDVATSQAFFNMVFSNEIVRDYVYFILDKAQLFNEWLPLISTGTQGNLNAQKLKEYIIPLPSLPEQEAIGTFFQTLDQEIAQVEDKLASLKETKKTLLRKLFV